MNRTNLQHGDVLLFKKGAAHGSLFGRIIRLFTGSPYTHSAIVLKDFAGNRFVVEQDGLVRVQRLDTYQFDHPELVTVWRNRELWIGDQEAMFVAWRMAGTKYGVANLFELALQHGIARVFPNWTWTPVFLPNDRTKCTCAGLIAKILVASVRPVGKVSYFKITTLVEPDDFNEKRGFRQVGVLDGNY